MGEVSDVRIENIEKVIRYARENLTEPNKDPMYPWVIVRSVENRIEKTDSEHITMTNSDLRRMIGGIARNVDKKEDLPQGTIDSMREIKESMDE